MADYTGLKRHVGKISNTARRIIVVFMRIPGDEGKALVVDTDALPPKWHDPIQKIVESAEGQQAENIGELFARRIMPDTGRNVLETLHFGQFLQSVPAELVIMYPRPNMPVPLIDITRQLNPEQSQEEIAILNQALTAAIPQVQLADPDNLELSAQVLLADAELLENDANAKREQAYSLVPTLRPEAKKVRAKKSINLSE